MASIRNLKKEINYITSELFLGAMYFQQLHQEVDVEDAAKIVINILQKRKEFIARVNNPHGTKDRKLTREYFGKLNKEFDQHIENTVKALEELAK